MTSVPHIPAAEPVAFTLRREFFEKLVTRWTDRTSGRGRSGNPNTGEVQTRAALEVIDGALVKLGTKSGNRADAAREYLTEQRARLGRALSAWLSIGEECDGAGFVAVCERLENAVEQHDDAERAYRACDEIDEVVALRDANDTARVARNAAVNAKNALLAAARLPALPNLDHFSVAESQTRALASGAPMTLMHGALDQGRDASPEIAKLWICYEGNGSKLFDARWARFGEARATEAPASAAAAE